MAVTGSAVNLSTLLLEKNRSNGKGPSLLVSDWMEEAGEAGFAGIEIAINHLLFSSRSEWELIRERSAETDLLIAAVSAILPLDASEKSQRFRDVLIEACEYFRPGNLKLTVSDPGSEGSLGFLKEWSRDVPRESDILIDGGEGTGAETLARAKAALSGGRFKAVIHPFLCSPKELDDALSACGNFIANLAVQAKKGGQRILLEENPDDHRKIVAAVRGRGFQGTWTLESTKGAGLPGENIERMFDHAEKDLNFLIEAQAGIR